MIDFIYKSKNLLVVYKPPLIPSQSDLTGDGDALTMAKSKLSTLGEPSDLWLVHRLDRVVGGLLVFARNKSTAAKLSEMVGGRGIEKEYLAVVEGQVEGGVLRDYIFKDSKTSKAFAVSSSRRGAKEASLEYTPIAECETEKGIYTLVRVKLHTGRFHQIRVQFASRGHSLVGDGKYGSRDNKAKLPALFATRLSFAVNDERVYAKMLPDINAYPWSLFKDSIK